MWKLGSEERMDSINLYHFWRKNGRIAHFSLASLFCHFAAGRFNQVYNFIFRKSIELVQSPVLILEKRHLFIVMVMSTNFRCRRTIKENYRETEKAVLDSILGKGYDKRIRPSGRNFTGTYILYFLHNFSGISKNKMIITIRELIVNQLFECQGVSHDNLMYKIETSFCFNLTFFIHHILTVTYFLKLYIS